MENKLQKKSDYESLSAIIKSKYQRLTDSPKRNTRT